MEALSHIGVDKEAERYNACSAAAARMTDHLND